MPGRVSVVVHNSFLPLTITTSQLNVHERDVLTLVCGEDTERIFDFTFGSEATSYRFILSFLAVAMFPGDIHANRLSDEILCNIFLQSEPRLQVIGVPAPISASITISHVCQRWRNLALSIGELWSFLDITLDPERWKETMDVFFTWIKRSGKSPLNYSLRCMLEDDDEPAQPHLTAEYMVKRLMKHQVRWENIHLECSFPVSFDFPAVKLKRMPMLKSLHFSFLFETYKGETLDAHISLIHSPRLEELKLSGSFVLETGKRTFRKLSGISDLQFYGEYANDSVKRQCLDLLKVTPNAQLFRASFNQIGANVIAKPVPNEKDVSIIHEMEFLVLENGNPAPDVIDKLTLPFLKSLYYGGYDTVGEGDILLKFVQRSLPPLTYLYISTFELEEDKLLSILRLLPGLRDLGLKYMALTARFFRELTPRVVCYEAESATPREGSPPIAEGSPAPEDSPAISPVSEGGYEASTDSSKDGTPEGEVTPPATEDGSEVSANSSREGTPEPEETPPATENNSEASTNSSRENTPEAEETPSVADDILSKALESLDVKGEADEGPEDPFSDHEETSAPDEDASTVAGSPPPDATPEPTTTPSSPEATEDPTAHEEEPRETESFLAIVDTGLCPALRSLEFDWLFLSGDRVEAIKSLCDMVNTRSSLFQTFETIQYDDREGMILPYDFHDDEYEAMAKIIEEKKWIRIEGDDGEWMRMHRLPNREVRA